MAKNDSTPHTIEIQLTKGYVTIVDEQDADLALRYWQVWMSAKRPYAITNGKINETRKHPKMHRVIVARMIGRELKREEYVDHIDNDSLNNRRCNLRICTFSQNAKNKKTYCTNKLRLKGVYERNGKFRAQIQVDKKKIMLGTFNTPEEAHRAYCEAAIKYYGEFARFR